jgi:hypothetical protein
MLVLALACGTVLASPTLAAATRSNQRSASPTSACPPATPPIAVPDLASHPATPPSTPLSVSGRYIVDASGNRVKFASVNWYGAEQAGHVPEGLEPLPSATQVIPVVNVEDKNDATFDYPKHDALVAIGDYVVVVEIALT